jgi:hypothetical protein
MGSYEDTVRTLEMELAQVEQAFRGLGEAEWATPTKLRPLGLDLTGALGREPMATPEEVALTAAIMDELLARRTVVGRPPDLGDDLAWVRAASGRGPEHPDPRLPLIG